MKTPLLLDWSSILEALGMDPIQGTCTRHPTCRLLPKTVDGSGGLRVEESTTGFHICRICESEFLSVVSTTTPSAESTPLELPSTVADDMADTDPASSSALWEVKRRQLLQQRKSMAPSIKAIQSMHTTPEWKQFTQQHSVGTVDDTADTLEKDEESESPHPTNIPSGVDATTMKFLQTMDPLVLLQQALLRSQQLHDWELLQHTFELSALHQHIQTLEKEKAEQAKWIEELETKIERQKQTIDKELKMIKTIAKKRANSRTNTMGGSGNLSDMMNTTTTIDHHKTSSYPSGEAPPKLPGRKPSSDSAPYPLLQQVKVIGDSWKNISSITNWTEDGCPPPPPPPLDTYASATPPMMPHRQPTGEPNAMAAMLAASVPPIPHHRQTFMESPPLKPVRMVSRDNLSLHHSPLPMLSPSLSLGSSHRRRGRRGDAVAALTALPLTENALSPTPTDATTQMDPPETAVIHEGEPAHSPVPLNKDDDDNEDALESVESTEVLTKASHPTLKTTTLDSSEEEEEDSSSESASLSASSAAESVSVGGRSNDNIVLEEKFIPPQPFDRKSSPQPRLSVYANHTRPSSYTSHMDERSSRSPSHNDGSNESISHHRAVKPSATTDTDLQQSKEIDFVPTLSETQEGGAIPAMPTIPPPFYSPKPRGGGGVKEIALYGQDTSPNPVTSRASISEHHFDNSQQLLMEASLALNSSALPTPSSTRLRKSLLKKVSVEQLSPAPGSHTSRRGVTLKGLQSSTVGGGNTQESQQREARAKSVSPSQNMTPLERHLAISNSPYHSRASSFQSNSKTNLGGSMAVAPPETTTQFYAEKVSLSQPVPHHSDSSANDEDNVDDELGDQFDDGAAQLKLGEFLQLGDYLEVERSYNLSPVSALTTGSYLKEQVLAAMADNEIQPRKALQNAEFAKKLPLEDDFDSGDDDDDDEAPGGARDAPARTERIDTQLEPMEKPPPSVQRQMSSNETQLHGIEMPPSPVQRKDSKMETDKRKISKKKEASQSQQEQLRRPKSGRSSKPVRRVDNETISDQYGDEGLYTGTVTVDSELPHGYGEMKYKNDRQYAGDWRSGRWHGNGRWSNPNGDVYEGTFDYDARHGAGVYTWKNGNRYEGEFFEDKRQGKGTFHFANGNEYIGDFVNGVFEGNGKYIFDGGEYNGSWVSGRYHGSGTLIFHDGTSYKGEFADGVAHGKGEETMADGKIRRGIWDQGRPQKTA